MNRHTAFLELAAAGLDFRLTAPEQTRLEAHLAACPACRARVEGLHADARSIAGLPEARLDPRRASSVLDAALHGPARSPVPVLRLALVAALVGALAIGAALVGAELLRRMTENDISVVPPVPTASPAPDASPLPDNGTPPPFGDLWAEAHVPNASGRPVGRIEAITAGGPGFVAVGRGCLSKSNGDIDRCEAIVWISSDGRTWERAPASDALDIGTYFTTSGPEIGMFDVAAGEPGIVAIGYAARPDMRATIWFSPDGTTWERIPVDLGTPPSGTILLPGARVDAVTWTGERFVVAGVDRSDGAHTAEELAVARPRAAVWTSTDGRTWTRVPDGAVPSATIGADPAVTAANADAFDIGGYIDTMEDPSTGGMADLLMGPEGLVAVGSVCEPGTIGAWARPGCGPAVWTSPDGTRWDRSEAESVGEGELGEGVILGSRIVGIGNWRCDLADYPSCPLVVGIDPDGTLTQPVSDAPSLSELTRVADRLLAIGNDPVDGEGIRTWASTDGLSWAPAAELPRRDASGLHLAAGNGVVVLIAEAGENPEPVAWYSDASVTE